MMRNDLQFHSVRALPHHAELQGCSLRKIKNATPRKWSTIVDSNDDLAVIDERADLND